MSAVEGEFDTNAASGTTSRANHPRVAPLELRHTVERSVANVVLSAPVASPGEKIGSDERARGVQKMMATLLMVESDPAPNYASNAYGQILTAMVRGAPTTPEEGEGLVGSYSLPRPRVQLGLGSVPLSLAAQGCPPTPPVEVRELTAPRRRIRSNVRPPRDS
ncbi:MAG: hypothetical protein L3K03_05325 [Thermoplasmata archaeon]|nr:hypothetical protein [Thermoplasmata archaeon]